MTIQITITRIEGYGRWTLQLGSDREAELQMLQAKIYYDLQRLFSALGGIVYPNRFDEYFVISNGISLQKHLKIQRDLDKLYPELSLSMAIGVGRTPFEANVNAYRSRKNQSLALDNRSRIFGKTGSSWLSQKSTKKYDDIAVQIMHIDVDDSTKLSSTLSPYEVTTLVCKVGLLLSQQFLKKRAITFFIGGDNFMVISNGTSQDDARKIIRNVMQKTKVKLNCGIGIGRTGRKAAEAATEGLDTIRRLRKTARYVPFYEINCL